VVAFREGAASVVIYVAENSDLRKRVMECVPERFRHKHVMSTMVSDITVLKEKAADYADDADGIRVIGVIRGWYDNSVAEETNL